jgi:hypothetical protein
LVAEINLSLENELKDIVKKKTINTIENIYSPSMAHYFYKSNGAWVSFLRDNKTNKIIGDYHGFTDVDQLSRKYNKRSTIKLHPQYQGKRLCELYLV